MSATITVIAGRQSLTEAEIRQHVLRAFSDDPKSVTEFQQRPEAEQRARRGAVAWEDAWQDVDEVIDSLWDMFDLRESEVTRLSELEHDAIAGIRDEIRPRVIEALIDAAVTFAAEHPDAPLRDAVA